MLVIVFIAAPLHAGGGDTPKEENHYVQLNVEAPSCALIGMFGELYLGAGKKIMWLDYFTRDVTSAHGEKHFTMNPVLKSETFLLNKNSRISYVHAISVEGDQDSIHAQFPSFDFCWRLRLFGKSGKTPLVTLDSLILHPQPGEKPSLRSGGLMGKRRQEVVRIAFGDTTSELYSDSLYLVLDMQPLQLQGMKYAVKQMNGAGCRFSDGLDVTYGYCLMDSIRAHGYAILDVRPSGAGFMNVDVAMPDSGVILLLAKNAEGERPIFHGMLPEGHSRVVVKKASIADAVTLELRDQSGKTLTRSTRKK